MEDFNKRLQAKKELIKAKITGSVTNQDSLEKGVYKDNDENKRLNRVGQKYGGKGVKGEEKTPSSKSKYEEAIDRKDSQGVVDEAKKFSIEELDHRINTHQSMADMHAEGGHSVLVNLLTKVKQWKIDNQEGSESKVEKPTEEKETREELFNQIDELRGEDLEDYLGLEEGETEFWDGTDREEAINDYLDAKFEEEEDEALSDEAGTEDENGVAFDHRDFAGGVQQFADQLKKLGGDTLERGDFLILSSKPISDEIQKDLDDDFFETVADNDLDMVDLVNGSVEELSDTFSPFFQELGYEVSEHPDFEGSDTFGYKIEKKS